MEGIVFPWDACCYFLVDCSSGVIDIYEFPFFLLLLLVMLIRSDDDTLHHIPNPNIFLLLSDKYIHHQIIQIKNFQIALTLFYILSSRYKMSECIFDMTALSHLRDSIVDIIKHQTEKELEPSKKLLQRIDERALVGFFLSIILSILSSVLLSIFLSAILSIWLSHSMPRRLMFSYCTYYTIFFIFLFYLFYTVYMCGENIFQKKGSNRRINGKRN